jgi:hypothetical protein
MKLRLSIALSLLCGLALSILPIQFHLPTGETILNSRGELINNPHVTWLNFLLHPDFYESMLNACGPGLAITFAPLLVALQWRFVQAPGWPRILLTFEGLILIGGAGALWLAMALTHANFMTGYSEWKDTPMLYLVPAYGVLTGIACLVAPWSAGLRGLLSRALGVE